jgi:hypothetical protein
MKLRAAGTVGLLGLAMALCLTACGASHPEIELSQLDGPFAPVALRVTGLSPGAEVTVAAAADVADTRFESEGSFTSDATGVIDLSTTSPVRAAFSQTVLGMSVVAVRMYWTRTMVSDHFPPTVRSTDEDVIAFVGARTGSVGYVSADAVLPDTVHVVAVQ